MLIDSHCHLTLVDLMPYQGQMEAVLAEGALAEVHHFLSVCVEVADIPALTALAQQFSQVSFSVGLHPSSEEPLEPDEDTWVRYAAHPGCIAIGETGLDYARLTSDEARVQQQDRFRRQIRAARRTGLPLIVHTREAQADTLRILKEEGAAEVGGVMHCFTESWEMARAALDLNFYISYSGIVTFKNATLVRDVAQRVPGDRLLIETDAPYLAPVPFRGQSNRPAWVRHTALALATLRQVPFEQLAAETTANFAQCFRTSIA